MKRIMTALFTLTACALTAAEPLKIEGRTTEPTITAAVHKQYPIAALPTDIKEIKHLATPAGLQITCEVRNDVIMLTSINLGIPDTNEIVSVHKTEHNDLVFMTKDGTLNYRVLGATIGLELKEKHPGKTWSIGNDIYVGIMPSQKSAQSASTTGAPTGPASGS